MSGLAAGDCGACIGGYCDEYCEVSQTKIVKARKPHKCLECNKIILIGERYERTAQLFEGEWLHCDVCLICAELGECLSCEGRVIGDMWSDIQDNIFPQMTTGCLAKLRTAAAKEHLLKRWKEWKFGDTVR